MGLLNSHLDDATFAEVWTDRLLAGRADAGLPAEAHLRACADCRGRFAAFSTWLEALRTDAHAEADELFSGDRLSIQQAQIGRRLEALEQPGRVIAFPRFAQPVATQPSMRTRWIGAAAAAGLVIGVGLGQVLHFGTNGAPRPFGGAAVSQTAGFDVPMAVQPASHLSDESYLYEQHEQGPSHVPDSLQYLNAITPSSRDYDPR